MFILNEKEYAEKCLETDHLDDKPFITFNVLAKYYYHALGYPKEKIVDLLVDYAEQNCYKYEKSKLWWKDVMTKLVSKVCKYPLYENDGVWISSNELETISSIHKKVLERLAFTLLCIAKLNMQRNPNNTGWVNNDTKEIFRLARITGTISEKESRLHKLYELGLIEFAKKIDNMGIKVKFIDDCDETLFVSDFRELGYEYLKYCGEDYIRCEKCGILIKDNKAHTKKYCEECVKYQPIMRKKIVCVDCGKEFFVSSMNNRSERCDECYEIYRRKYKAQKEKERVDKVGNGEE